MYTYMYKFIGSDWTLVIGIEQVLKRNLQLSGVGWPCR